MEINEKTLPAYFAFCKLFRKAAAEELKALNEKEQGLAVLYYLRQSMEEPGTIGKIARQAMEEIAAYSYERIRMEG